MKAVVFQSTVTFESRVTFKDTDMAGSAIIQAGSRSVQVIFDTPYSIIPKITASADSFARYRITNKSVN